MKRRIGELLVEEGYVTAEQVHRALQVQKKQGGRIGTILMDLGYLTEQTFLEFLGTVSGTASVELSHCEIESDVLKLIPRETAWELEVVPIARMRNLLTIAMVCPLDAEGRARLEDVTKLRIKPVLCSKAAVRSALERYYNGEEPQLSQKAESETSTLEASLRLQRVGALVEQIEELPTLPEILGAISAVVNDPGSSASDLGRLIATDGALSAKVLKLANSPAFGFSRRVSDINQAVALLGFRETQALAMSASVFDYFAERAAFDFKAYWNHSFACATLARLICLKKRGVETAFISGLLHDVGKLVLAMTMGGKQENANQLHKASGVPSLEAEEKVLGLTHAEVGYQLAEHWLLPVQVATAIRFHHAPESEPDPKGPAGAVFLADLFSRKKPSELQEAVLDERTLQVLKTLTIAVQDFRNTLRGFGEASGELSLF
jgi:HD-like signal output (HDOD) protein